LSGADISIGIQGHANKILFNHDKQEKTLLARGKEGSVRSGRSYDIPPRPWAGAEASQFTPQD
jgi:hypothetical protein